jgi:hypothetical protein
MILDVFEENFRKFYDNLTLIALKLNIKQSNDSAQSYILIVVLIPIQFTMMTVC